MDLNKNNVSKVPKFTFAKDLRAQKNQLKSNELVKRFSESRKDFSKDK